MVPLLIRKEKLNPMFFIIVWFSIVTADHIGSNLNGGVLYPKESETRQVKSLDGLWNFRLSKPDSMSGFKEKWFEQDLHRDGLQDVSMCTGNFFQFHLDNPFTRTSYLRKKKDGEKRLMDTCLNGTGPVLSLPVPSSYNDITMDREIRDHLGFVWYDRTFFVPDMWRQEKYHVWLRFGSVHYAAQVWINGQLVMSHEIGHLPFHHEITSAIQFGKENRVTVAVDNTLLQNTLPQGTLQELVTNNGTEWIQTYTFDFFNYAGIHRSVHLYTTPIIYIDDVTINTDIASDGTTGLIHYIVTIAGPGANSGSVHCFIDLFDQNGDVVKQKNKSSNLDGLVGTIKIPNANFWWPYLMDSNPGYLYTLQIQIMHNESGNDIYRQNVGIRSLKWNNTSVTINGKPIYMRGFGRHEDSDIRGKGLDFPLVTRDYELLKWIGANSYRTSHYPYAEEIMDFADRYGIMIIDECPAVGTENYSPVLMQKHIDSLAELIRRDKNRPSVIMWSIANEPKSQLKEADDYYRHISNRVRQLDQSRPITAAIAVSYASDYLGQYLDVIGFNRYNSWYTNTGRLEVIRIRVEEEAKNWHSKHNKPIFMSEYGADTMAGLHSNPSYVWSEEYQVEMFSEHFMAFDNLRRQNFFIGEMIWNFADFNTAQTVTRVGGNRKGVFTRQRQPKMSAHFVRKRYWAIAKQLDNVTLPIDLGNYFNDVELGCSVKPELCKSEL